MSRSAHPDRLVTRPHRSTYLLGYLVIVGYAVRRLTELEDIGLVQAIGLLVTSVALYATQPRLTRRFARYPSLYFALQMLVVQVLGAIEVYQDTWAVLYIVLGLQATVLLERREAYGWGGLFAISTLITICFEFGIQSGFGRALAFIVVGIFLVSYDIQYSRREDAQAESQVLLDELQAAHQRLKTQAAQAERLAAAQERNWIAQEIYDAVGQKVFAIQLLAETTCVLLEQDAQSASPQLVLLQEQTQAALGQMRELITRWRTPPKVEIPIAPLPLLSEL